MLKFSCGGFIGVLLQIAFKSARDDVIIGDNEIILR
jgi:hypothetical protein